jgi:hypothetical protein
MAMAMPASTHPGLAAALKRKPTVALQISWLFRHFGRKALW